MNKIVVTIFESWKRSSKSEILVEIQHSLNGLRQGTILKSEASGFRWRVVSRTIFTQAENQKRFAGETEAIQHFSFKEPIEESLSKFQNDISEKELKGIYHYCIVPIGHENKPASGDVLEVE